MQCSQNILEENPFQKVSLHVPLKNKHKNNGINKFEKLKIIFVCMVHKMFLERNPLKSM